MIASNRHLWKAAAMAATLIAIGSIAAAQESNKPQALGAEVGGILSEGEVGAATKGWKMFNIMHVDQAEVPAVAASLKDFQFIRVFQCGGSAAIHQQNLKTFGPLATLYTYWSFRNVETKKPQGGELLWPGLDHPFVNQLREMRKIATGTPLMGIINENIGLGSQKRQATAEEIRWQAVAILGADHRAAILSGGADDLRNLLVPYARVFVEAYPVDWASAADGQPLSAKAAEDVLFVFLLDRRYMKLESDGQTVQSPTEDPICKTSIHIALPQGLHVRRALCAGDKIVPYTASAGSVAITREFKGGADVLVLQLSEKIKPPAPGPTSGTASR